MSTLDTQLQVSPSIATACPQGELQFGGVFVGGERAVACLHKHATVSVAPDCNLIVFLSGVEGSYKPITRHATTSVSSTPTTYLQCDCNLVVFFRVTLVQKPLIGGVR